MIGRCFAKGGDLTGEGKGASRGKSRNERVLNGVFQIDSYCTQLPKERGLQENGEGRLVDKERKEARDEGNLADRREGHEESAKRTSGGKRKSKNQNAGRSSQGLEGSLG